MPRPQLRLSELGGDKSLEDSFAIQDGQFIRGAVEISNHGLSRTDRPQRAYHGLQGSDIETLRNLGRGTSSLVNLVRHRNTGMLMALKVINMYERSKRQQIMQEIATLYDARCECLVGFYGAFFQEGAISIALEFMDQGCLATVVKNYGCMPENVLAATAYQALWGLAYLKHDRRLHRDVKPQNILCNSRGEVKLTDFGISKELENSIGLCQTFVGTFKFMSPERIRSVPYSYPSDIWSLGIVLIECLTGTYPYPECLTPIDMAQTILESPAPMPDPTKCSPQFADFISCCLKKEPNHRVPADVLLRGAPWLQMYGLTSTASARELIHLWFAELSQSPGGSRSLGPRPPPPRTGPAPPRQSPPRLNKQFSGSSTPPSAPDMDMVMT